jgi:hypothetical protein
MKNSLNSKILSIIKKQAGKFHSITFVKQDNSLRRMQVQRIVGGKPGKGYIDVYDVHAQDVRRILLDNIIYIRAEGETYEARKVPWDGSGTYVSPNALERASL